MESQRGSASEARSTGDAKPPTEGRIFESLPSSPTQTASIYPTAPPFTIEVIDQTSKQRVQYMLSEIYILHEKLQHYEKLERRNLKLTKALRLFGLTSCCFCQAAAVAIQIIFPGISLPISIPVGLSGFAIPGLFEVINKLLDVKRNRYLNKIEILKEYQNKLWLFTSEAAEDKNISMQELDKFQSILVNYNCVIRDIEIKSEIESKNLEKIVLEFTHQVMKSQKGYIKKLN